MTVLRQVKEVADNLVSIVNQNMDVGEAYLKEFDEQFQSSDSTDANKKKKAFLDDDLVSIQLHSKIIEHSCDFYTIHNLLTLVSHFLFSLTR